MWSAILDRVLRRPLVAAVLAAGVLVALAIPALGMHTASAGIDALPQGHAGHQDVQPHHRGVPGRRRPPPNVVVKAKDVTTPEVAGAITQLKARAAGSKTAINTTDVDISKDKTVALVELPIAGKGNDATSWTRSRRSATTSCPRRSARSTAPRPWSAATPPRRRTTTT